MNAGINALPIPAADTNDLQESIAKNLIAAGFEVEPDDLGPTAAAVLPIIREAQADAWEKGKGDGLRQADYEYGARSFYAATNPYRASETE